MSDVFCAVDLVGAKDAGIFLKYFCAKAQVPDEIVY